MILARQDIYDLITIQIDHRHARTRRGSRLYSSSEFETAGKGLSNVPALTGSQEAGRGKGTMVLRRAGNIEPFGHALTGIE